MQEGKSLFSSSRSATLALQMAQAALRQLPEDKRNRFGGLWVQFDVKVTSRVNIHTPTGYQFDIYVAGSDTDLAEVPYPTGNQVRVECKNLWQGRGVVEVCYSIDSLQYSHSFNAHLCQDGVKLETRYEF